MRSGIERRTPTLLIGALSLLEFIVFLFGPFGMQSGKTPSDYLFMLLVLLHAIWAYRIATAERRLLLRALFRTPEVLMALTLVLFLLSYIFASNANMSYVQRFAATHGNIRLAPDSTVERLNSALRFLPLLLIQAWMIAYYRIRYPRTAVVVTTGRRARGGTDWARKRSLARVPQRLTARPALGDFPAVWALPLVLIGAFLYVLAFPSFLDLAGIGALGFVCLVPLLIVLYRVPFGWGIFYGTAFGVLETMLTNFWLGTFSLVSLQFVTGVMILEFALFMTLLLWLFRRLKAFGYLIVPIAWVGFDLLRSDGFLGFPWGMLGVTQYRFTSLIQIAAVTGVWGVTFVVTLANAVIAHILSRPFAQPRRALAPAAGYLILLLALLVEGNIASLAQGVQPVARTVTIALIQQNTDPRKTDYTHTFDVLKRLTDNALFYRPDLVVWSETAFVPNIRRWSTLDPEKYPLAKLVREFEAYQRSLGTWLLTGNDDYTLTPGPNGTEKRKDYNAAVLFSPQGQRMQTYHKIHLVPFTEYFPYRKQLPFVYDMLTHFDVYLWEPGTERTVFWTPKVTFSTPICFEDAFPNDVREFVRAGAKIILNISNDYWSLTPVEGMQHYVNALFRAVENRRPLLSATASGVTAYVDTSGRLVERLPFYKPAYLIAKVPLYRDRETIYTRYGDWFPKLALLLFAILLFVSYSPSVRGRVARP